MPGFLASHISGAELEPILENSSCPVIITVAPGGKNAIEPILSSQPTSLDDVEEPQRGTNRVTADPRTAASQTALVTAALSLETLDLKSCKGGAIDSAVPNLAVPQCGKVPPLAPLQVAGVFDSKKAAAFLNKSK